MEQQLLHHMISQPVPNFDNFVTGENIQLIELLKDLPKAQALYIWGHNGCGKTHLLKAAVAQYQGIYLNNHDMGQIDFHNIPPLIAIDDVHTFSTKHQDLLFKLYYEWKKRQETEHSFRLLISGTCPPLTLKVREDLRNRLGYDLVFRIQELNDDDLLQALETRASILGFSLSTTLPKWLFNHYSRNIRVLFDLFSKLDKYTLKKKTNYLSITVVKNFLEESHEN